MTTTDISRRRDDYLAKRRVTVVGALINLVLAIAKVVFGIISQSQALVADGVHSLSDLASDAMVLVAAKYHSQGADAEHPYGHARFETVATIGLGLLLLAVAVGITVDAVERILNPAGLLRPGVAALAVTVISILSKEWLYHYTVRAARQVHSEMLRANAWHHRTDAISSVIVLVGIVGTMAGMTYLDAVAAIGVSLLIGKIGWDLGWRAVHELVDSGVEPEKLRDIRSTIESVDGVQAFHMLRTRRMGGEVLVEMHILVDSQVTVSEGHLIGDRVRERLLAEHGDISEVLVHIDPEDDDASQPSSGLPGRAELLKELDSRWGTLDAARSIENVYLHYLDGMIDVEVILPMDVARDLEDARRIADGISEQGRDVRYVRKIAVYFS